MNEANEIGGDLLEEYEAIQADEANTCTDCESIVGHLTLHDSGAELCDHCEDHHQDQERYRADARCEERGDWYECP